MYVLGQKSSLEAAKVLPQPRLDVLMPRFGLAAALWLWPRPRLGIVSFALLRLETSQSISYITKSKF